MPLGRHILGAQRSTGRGTKHALPQLFRHHLQTTHGSRRAVHGTACRARRQAASQLKLLGSPGGTGPRPRPLSINNQRRRDGPVVAIIIIITPCAP